jgi:hypothetical protein
MHLLNFKSVLTSYYKIKYHMLQMFLLMTYQSKGLSLSIWMKKVNQRYWKKTLVYGDLFGNMLLMFIELCTVSKMLVLRFLQQRHRFICQMLSYPIHSHFSSEVLDVRSDQIRSTDPYRIRHDKLLHSYPVHITLNTAYFLHLVYPPFRCIGYAFFRLCLLTRLTCD